MKVLFFKSDKPRERALARAFQAGAVANGVECDVVALGTYPPLHDVDAACMVGVKSRVLFEACRQAGVVPIMLDKGYIRDRRADARIWEYWRVSVGSHHPTAYLMDEAMPDDRFNEQLNGAGLPLRPWRAEGDHILLAGSSAKYHAFYGIEEPTRWARGVISQLRELTSRPIIYRPKPSWDGAVPITKTIYSGPKDKLRPILESAWAVVTHGSNISFEAALAGVPSIVLGDGIGKPISSTTLDEIEQPRLGERQQWLQNLCYWQWTEDEMRAGAMWRFIAPRIPQRER